MRNLIKVTFITFIITTSFLACIRDNNYSQELTSINEQCERKYLNTKTNEKMCNPIGYEEQPESNFSLLLKIFI